MLNKLTSKYGGPVHYLGNRFLSLPNMVGQMTPDTSWLEELFSVILFNTNSKKISRCFEPFAGSASWSLAAMELNLADEYIINDSDDVLINMHQLIRDEPIEIKNTYSKLYGQYRGTSSKRDFFQDLIHKYNNSIDQYDKALLLPFIINYSWGGILRHDHNKNIIYLEDDNDHNVMPKHLPEAHLNLEMFQKEVDRVNFLFNANKVIFKHGDFQPIVADAKKGDFVALNPPYPENKNAQTNNTGMYVELYSHEKLYKNLVDTLKIFEKERIDYYMTYGFYNPSFSNFVITDDTNHFRHFFRILGYKDCAYGMALDQMYFSSWFSIPKNLQSIIIPARLMLEDKNLTIERAMKKFHEVSKSFMV